MWHIVLMGYVFTTLMFAVAQPGLARQLIYLVVFTVLPTLFAFWVAMVRRRNRLMKLQERRAEITAADAADSDCQTTPVGEDTPPRGL
ncbi:hypothetical protein LNQ82_04020 [Conchiformibius steedae DSM 2580]|uniref:Uncharacterized protein n=1 Tax=Conchiformibius steedae DSM 2580 TaxID=1121352 RepID=A0AAE9HYL0_9NEIS|nr:hypothetical protein [Conchiformibius steedae]QMT32631.1 hypothetical protein H3L98_01095 [Conchiformibius steedae]URD68330.1 hypothetical protein LNQ82_04020 [Conchiformibius steedae DSM 2580]